MALGLRMMCRFGLALGVSLLGASRGERGSGGDSGSESKLSASSTGILDLEGAMLFWGEE